MTSCSFRFLIGTTLALCLPAIAMAEDYDLLHPVPENQLRDLDTDRPDKTNSPYTLDAGHFQWEMDFLSAALDRENGIRGQELTWGNSNLRVGLLPWLEAQFMVPFEVDDRTENLDNHTISKAHGMGDLTVAMKANFWGNDSGDTAAGAAFYLKTPTATQRISNGKTEENFLLLWQTSLPAEMQLGLNAGLGWQANDSNHLESDPSLSASVSRSLIGPLGAYSELYADWPAWQTDAWVSTFDVGLTYQIGKNLQFDSGVNFGLTRAADDHDLFVGVSARY